MHTEDNRDAGDKAVVKRTYGARFDWTYAVEYRGNLVGVFPSKALAERFAAGFGAAGEDNADCRLKCGDTPAQLEFDFDDVPVQLEFNFFVTKN